MPTINRAYSAPVAVLLLLAVLASGAFEFGCGGSSASQTDDSDEMVGDPPSEADDPFQIAETPETAEEAETSGYVGEGDEEDETSGAADPDEADESEPVAVRAEEAEPESRRDAPERAGEHRCFSCVRICPPEGADADCDNEERDVICGWGVHETREEAEALARAECNGALDMAREMKSYSRIEGECPSADCRQPEK